MTKTQRLLWLCVLLVGGSMVGVVPAGCGKDHLTSRYVPQPIPRRSVVWLDDTGIDLPSATCLQQAGVDEIVIRLGSVVLTGDVPVPRLVPMPLVEGDIPRGIALRVQRADADLDARVGQRLWNALQAEVGADLPIELLLELATVPEGMGEFIRGLRDAAGMPVMPVLVPAQLDGPATAELVSSAGGCVVVAFGNVELYSNKTKRSNKPLPIQLAPLSKLPGVRVRVAMVINPLTIPALDGWAEDLNALTEGQVAEVSTLGEFDRAIRFREPFTWSGRSWNAGDQIAVRWNDASRLNFALAEMCRMGLPELGGWDIMSLPPTDNALGLGRGVLCRYLAGEGPAPELELTVTRRRGVIQATLTNHSPFASTISSFGNWLEIYAADGHLVAEEGPGSFDRVALGNRAGGSWQQVEYGNVNAVRFIESYVGPNEVLTSGAVRIVSSGTQIQARYNIVLSSGEEVSEVQAVQ